MGEVVSGEMEKDIGRGRRVEAGFAGRVTALLDATKSNGTTKTKEGNGWLFVFREVGRAGRVGPGAWSRRSLGICAGRMDM